MNDIDNKIWNFEEIKQEFTSQKTSVNSHQMPKTIKKIMPLLKKGQRWADLGGGKFDNVQRYFESIGIELLIFDPFNRTAQHNHSVIQQIANGQCDGVMVNNVLNVIIEKNNRKKIISQTFDCLKIGGVAYFKIYEGNCSGIVNTSTNNVNSAQLNQPTQFYLEEIQSFFGENLKVSKEFIVAKKIFIYNNNINKTIDELILQSKIHNIPQRNKKTNVGKFIGGNLYIHKNYINVLPSSYNKALEILNENTTNFDFQIIKFNQEKNIFSFIQSPDFDTKDEPTVGDSIQISLDGMIKFTKKKKDPQIYHHKWNFVSNDYKGFNVKESIQRSIDWKSSIGKNKEISSRIGTSSFWEQTVKNLNITNKKLVNFTK